MKTLYDAADGFQFQYPASYMDGRTTSGFRVEQDDSNRGSFLKIAEEFTTSGCQSLGLENTSSCRVTRKRQYKNPQGLPIAEMDMVNTCSGECDDFVPMRFTVYVANISQKGTKQFIVFEDMIHYTMVKTTMFNGVTHPGIGIWSNQNEFRLIREFGYQDYKNRSYPKVRALRPAVQ